MTKQVGPSTTNERDEDPHSVSTAENIQLWQHFVSTGGADKDRMITITTWLLAFSAALIGYIATQNVADVHSRFIVEPKAGIFAVLGIVVSIFALYVVRIYCVHASWNWNKADTIAEREPAVRSVMPPRDRPKAPVFAVFFALALGSLLIHSAVVFWSIFG